MSRDKRHSPLDREQRGSGESRLLILQLALRAIRWRSAASATVFIVAVIAILAATIGPIYLHALDQTVLTRHLSDASPSERDVLVSRDSEAGFPGVNWASQVHELARQFAPDDFFAPPVSEEQVAVDYGSVQQLKSEVASVAGLCAHLRIVRGRCVSGNATGEALISEASAKAERLTVGDTLSTTTATGITIPLRIVGTYDPVAPTGSFWGPWALFQFGQPAVDNNPAPGDALFVNSSSLLSRVQKATVELSENLALRPGTVGYNDIGELRTTIAQANAASARLAYRVGSSGIPVASITTSLPGVLNQTAKETSLARTLVTVATAQLALLAILMLYVVVANTAVVQGPEVALAKLRGRRSGSVILQSIAQPVSLVLAAAPVGALLAWLVVRLLAAHLLKQHVDVAFPPAAFGVAVLGVAGGVLAAVAAARRIIVTPVGALMRLGSAPAGSRLGLLIADVAAVTLALAGLIELKAGGVLNSGKPNPLSVLGPTLLAVAAGVVVLRLLPFAGRRLARWTRDSPRLAIFLAVRQLLRRPAEARAVLLVAVAVSIAAFALTTWADSNHNRSLRALNSAGAYMVLLVKPAASVYDLRTAVDKADPSGHSMAVAYTSVDNLPPLIAVDTARFATVGAWVSGNAPVPLGSVLHRLAASPPPVTLTGTRLRLHVDLTEHPKGPVQLAIKISQPDHRLAMRTVARVAPGSGLYELSLPATCANGCAVTALELTANVSYNLSAAGTQTTGIRATIGASVDSDAGWRPVPSFGDPARWRDSGGPANIGAAGSSLSLELRQLSGWGWPSVVSAAIPTVIPAVVASAEAAVQVGNQIHSVQAVGLDRQSIFIDGVVQSVTLPQVDRDGVMVDFGTALAVMNQPAAATTQYQVWLSPDAPQNMPARLARQHVYVQRTIRSQTYRAVLDNSGPAFADSLFLLSALAAILLAISATAVAGVLSVRRRSYELAALEAVGVSPRTLRRALATEQGSIFGVGLCVGLAAGLVGAGLALPSTPVFVDTSTGPPLVLGLPWPLLAALTVGMVVLFILASVTIGKLAERAATPSQLRGAQQ